MPAPWDTDPSTDLPIGLIRRNRDAECAAVAELESGEKQGVGVVPCRMTCQLECRPQPNVAVPIAHVSDRLNVTANASFDTRYAEGARVEPGGAGKRHRAAAR